MSKPRVLRIAGHRWRVSWSAAAVRRLTKDEAAGACRPDLQEIAIDPLPNGPTQERHVLLHEVLHACFAAVEFDVDTEAEERIVRAVCGPLLQTLRDNPVLVRYLVEEL